MKQFSLVRKEWVSSGNEAVNQDLGLRSPAPGLSGAQETWGPADQRGPHDQEQSSTVSVSGLEPGFASVSLASMFLLTGDVFGEKGCLEHLHPVLLQEPADPLPLHK